ncbi:hypothetical protein PYCC9005_004392 [Savitreella phatthalungensis]
MDLHRSVVERKLQTQSTASRPGSKHGSRGGSRAGSAYATDDELEDDNLSSASFDSFDEPDGKPASTSGWEEGLGIAIEGLLERKGLSQESREKSLQTSCAGLAMHYAPSKVRPLCGTLTRAVLKMLQRARSEREAVLCCRLIALLGITLPDETDEIFSPAMSMLRQTVRDSTYSAAKVAALFALTALTLILADDEEARELMDFGQEIVEGDGHTIGAPDDPTVVAAALDAIAVACSQLNNLTDAQLVLPCCVDQLESIDAFVRQAAGEAIALCFEVCAVDTSDEDTMRSYQEDPPYEDLRRLTQLLEQLATASSKRQSKTSRREQHAVFRAVAATVSDPSIAAANAPAVTLRFGLSAGSRCVLFATTWAQLARLALLRRLMGSGLQAHLRRNGAVRALLGYEGPHPGLYAEGVPPEEQSLEENGSESTSASALDAMSKDLRVSINQEIRKQRHRERGQARKEKTMESSWTADDFNE